MIFLLSGCATPPDTDYDVLRAQDSADQVKHIQLLREKDQDAAGEPFVEGNKVELLQNGDATLLAMLAAIKKARRYVNMESFTFDDKAGKQFADALIARQRKGVKINLIYDAWGSSDTPPRHFRLYDGARHHAARKQPG